MSADKAKVRRGQRVSSPARERCPKLKTKFDSSTIVSRAGVCTAHIPIDGRGRPMTLNHTYIETH